MHRSILSGGLSPGRYWKYIPLPLERRKINKIVTLNKHESVKKGSATGADNVRKTLWLIAWLYGELSHRTTPAKVTSGFLRKVSTYKLVSYFNQNILDHKGVATRFRMALIKDKDTGGRVLATANKVNGAWPLLCEAEPIGRWKNLMWRTYLRTL